MTLWTEFWNKDDGESPRLELEFIQAEVNFAACSSNDLHINTFRYSGKFFSEE